RPAIILKTVDFPHPDGPTRTMNSPSRISRSRWLTAITPPRKTLSTWSRTIFDILSIPVSWSGWRVGDGLAPWGGACQVRAATVGCATLGVSRQGRDRDAGVGAAVEHERVGVDVLDGGGEHDVGHRAVAVVLGEWFEQRSFGAGEDAGGVGWVQEHGAGAVDRVLLRRPSLGQG